MRNGGQKKDVGKGSTEATFEIEQELAISFDGCLVEFTLDVEVFCHAGSKQEKKVIDRADVSAEFRMPFVYFYSREWRSFWGYLMKVARLHALIKRLA